MNFPKMIFLFFFFWGNASEDNEERREGNGYAVLWKRAATEINAIRSTRETMSQGVGGGIRYPWTATIVVANNPDTPVDERFFTVEEKDSGMRETHKRKWVFQFCTIETATIVVTAKLKSSKHQRNYCRPVLVLTLQMWLCKTSFLVRWSQHFDFVEQFSNTRGILIFILFSLLVKEGLNKNNEIRITFIKRHKFKIKLFSNKFYSRS